MEQTATRVLLLLVKMSWDEKASEQIDGPTLQKLTKLSIKDLNDAIWLLKRSGYVDTVQYLETHDFNFTYVSVTPLGRYEAERASSTAEESGQVRSSSDNLKASSPSQVALPPIPLGSPFGFTDQDWEYISLAKDNTAQLVVALGYQFHSDHYVTEDLKANIRSMFQKALDAYSASPGALPAELSFVPLRAGYGEHLFNEIARDIIASDIAVFETSDLNPNVMIELGVALTWGVRVLPIREASRPLPPSDISGQTWAQYTGSAANFTDPDHDAKLVRMIERAVQKKVRR
jgi:hypothetical protein